MNLSSLTKPEIDYLRENLNLTEDEDLIFTMLTQGKSRVQMSLEINLSLRTVDNRILAIKQKMRKI